MIKILFGSFKILNFFLLLISGAPLIAASQENQADCQTCYEFKKEDCSQSCNKHIKKTDSGKIEKCKRKCILNECSQQCGYNLDRSKKSNSLIPDTVSCDYCTRSAKKECSANCAESENPSCLKICVSQTCSNSCSLPDSTKELFRKENSTCEECRKKETDLCSQNCPSGTGSITCKVACVERACASSCLID